MKVRAFLNFIREKNEFIILAVSFCTIIFGFLNYHDAWCHPEVERYEIYSLEGDTSLTGIIKKSFDVEWFEVGEPRPTRPLDHFLMIINTNVRQFLAEFLSPHPAFSITYIFLLIILPYLFYRLLKKMKVSTSRSILGSTLLLASPGVMSLLSCLFRPGKPMMMTLMALVLFLFPVDSIRIRNARKIIWVIVLIVVAMLFDETAFIIPPALVILFGNRKTIWSTLFIALLSIIFGLIFYFGINPFFTNLFHGDSVNLLDYQHVKISFDFEVFFEAFVTNIYMAIFDSLGVFENGALLSRAWLLFNIVMLHIVLFSIARDIYMKKNCRCPFLLRSILLFFVGIVFLSVIMMDKGNPWGIYWYGVFSSFFFVLFYIQLIEYLCISRYFKTLIVVVCICFSLSKFDLINSLYREWHDCDPNKGEECFEVRDIFLHGNEIRPIESKKF